MSNNLGIGRIAPNSANPEVATNDALEVIDSIFSQTLEIDLSSANVSVPAADLKTHGFIRASGALVARNLTLIPTMCRVAIFNDSVAGINVKVGTSTEALASGAGGIFYLDGTANGLDLIITSGTSSGGGGTDPGDGGGGGGGTGALFDPPLASFLSDTSSLSAGGAVSLTDDADVGLILKVSPAITGDKFSAALHSVTPAADWDFKARISPTAYDSSYQFFGIVMFAAGQVVPAFGWNVRGTGVPQLLLAKWNAAGNGFNGAISNSNNIFLCEWLRAKYTVSDGKIRLYFSRDGKAWNIFDTFNVSDVGGERTKVGLGFGLNYAFAGYDAVMSSSFLSLT